LRQLFPSSLAESLWNHRAANDVRIVNICDVRIAHGNNAIEKWLVAHRKHRKVNVLGSISVEHLPFQLASTALTNIAPVVTPVPARGIEVVVKMNGDRGGLFGNL
jgi:hypothetical protein